MFLMLFEMYDYAKLYDVYHLVQSIPGDYKGKSRICLISRETDWTQNVLIDYRGLQKEGQGNSLKISASLVG